MCGPACGRDKENLDESYLLTIDGDAAKGYPDKNCIPFEEIEAAVRGLNINFVLLTSYSQSDIRNRWSAGILVARTHVPLCTGS
jgi:hypothetical protein